ncbi:FAD/NAD(P)-binding protein [Gemmobacter sp.]|uniref:FAD/NAD(P)-binding protein n=1 Tax=Gemmobacter sp. TaxID=1898957 RepID=UPI002AFEA16F|nr:FAD/NAD(P)-binding protein [Gemmobacter sp.]
MGARQNLAIIGDGAVAAAFLATARLVPGDRLTLIGPSVGRFGAGRFYADHDARQPWRLAYLLDRPNGEMAEGFADWLAGEWPALLPEIAAAQPLHLRRWSEALSEGAFGDFAAPRAIYGRYLVQRSSDLLAKLVGDGVQVRLITGLATDLSRAGDLFRITLATGEVIEADRVDVATGGSANQRFGADAGPTAFTTLYGNEEAIARVLKPGWEVTCLGASTEVLDVMHFLRSAWPNLELRLRVLRDRATPALDGDPEYRRLRAAGRIVEEIGRPIWVYAETAGNVRLRITGKECHSKERTVPLAINTAGPGDQLLVDLLVSGMIAKGWLKLNAAQNRIDVGAGFATEIEWVRYASDAVAILKRRPGGAVGPRVEELVGSLEGGPVETA